MIKKQLLLFLLLFGSFVMGFAQLLSPVKWNLEQKSAGEGEAELIFTASIQAGWHLYSTELPEGGPIKTTFLFTADSSRYQLVDKIASKNAPTREHDKIFNMDLEFFSNKAIFVQK